MEFRLFATSDDTDDTPTSIVILNPKAPVEIYVHRDREDLDESPGSERMRQIIASAIDAKTILEQAAVPWVTYCLQMKKNQNKLKCRKMKKGVRRAFVGSNPIVVFTTLFTFFIGENFFCSQSHECTTPSERYQFTRQEIKKETRVRKEGQSRTDFSIRTSLNCKERQGL